MAITRNLLAMYLGKGHKAFKTELNHRILVES